MKRRQAVLVVGAGFAGAIVAERLAAAGHDVVVFEERTHLAGNAFDERDAHGVLVHRYGPHIFHTGSAAVVDYLSRFTAWRPYVHRVLARLPDGRLAPLPINRTTLGMVTGQALEDDQAAAVLLERLREPHPGRRTSEEVVLDSVGRQLYELFFRGYTRKQWGRDPAELDPSVTSRIPTRTSTDDRYFSDAHQAMPADGFTPLFERLLHHPRIRVELGRRFNPATDRNGWSHLVYTGPIDLFFGHRLGRLPYRSLRFEHQHLPDTAWFQPVGVVNEPAPDVPFTRTTEFKHLTGQIHSGTSIVREYPQDDGEPYYPVPAFEAKALHARYAALAEAETGVSFVGRLAQYRYLNMDQAAAAALALARTLT